MIFPAKENNFLGYVSLEAFVRENLHKLDENPKKGAFKIITETCGDDSSGEESSVKVGASFFLRDIVFENDYVSFFSLNPDENKIYCEFNIDGSHLPLRKPDESMLEYFDRMESELNGYWVHHTVYQPYAVRLFGQFSYKNNKVVHNDDKFSNKYAQATRVVKRSLKTVSKTEEPEDKVVKLASRRDSHDKPL